MQHLQLFESFSFVFENRGPHKYGCAMVYFDFPEMKTIQDQIEKDDIYTDPDDPSFGLEKDPHTTILYGFHKDVDYDKVRDIIKDEEFESVEATKVSKFDNAKYDVLKFDVECKTLHKLNRIMTTFDHTNKFPDYHPHITIAYLQPGTAKKYIKLFKDQSFTLTPKKGVISVPGKEKQVTFKISVKEA